MTNLLRVLHILPHLRAGGAAGSLAATARAGAGSAEHRVLPLEPIISPLSRLELARARVAILPPGTDPAAATDAADVLVLHFWNTPHSLSYVDTLPARLPLVLWVKVAGGAPPQVVPPSLPDRANRIILTAASTRNHPPLRDRRDLADRTTVVRGIADFSRLGDLRPVAHAGFVVAYVGTVGPGKIHPDFVGLSLSADIPDARFVVCGGGGGELEIARRAAEAGAADRFELRGYVRDVGHVLSGADVFGYPLAADTYSSSDRALQEAMFAGVPPVILRHGGIVDMVIHEETGFVVDERDYGAALALLHGDPALRRRIGAAAARHARAAFDAETAAARAHAVFLAAAGEQPRGHPSASTVARPFAAARRFATALGSFGAAFVASLDGRAPEAGAADVTIAHTPAATARVEGGLFHHRNAAPQDGMLHYWSGLVLAAEGETAGAERELAAALEGGVATWRAAAWRGRIAAREGRAAAAIGHGAVALAAAPDADAAAWVARIIDPASNPLISVTP